MVLLRNFSCNSILLSHRVKDVDGFRVLQQVVIIFSTQNLILFTLLLQGTM